MIPMTPEDLGAPVVGCPLARDAACPGWAGPCVIDLGADCPDVWGRHVAMLRSKRTRQCRNCRQLVHVRWWQRCPGCRAWWP